jgi:hypothetical protein
MQTVKGLSLLTLGLFIAGALAAIDTTNQLITTLHCDTSLLVDGQTLADEAPFAAITADTARMIFQLQNQTLKDQVYITILAAETFNVTVLDKNGTAPLANCRPIRWADLIGAFKAIDILPGEHKSCIGIPGCDGLGINTIQMLRAFNYYCPHANIRSLSGNFTIDVRIRFSSVGDVVYSPLLSFASRRLLEALPDNATTIGDSDVVSVNVTISDALYERAFPPGEFTTKTKWIIGGIIAGIALVLVVGMSYALGKAMCAREEAKRKSEMHRLNNSARGDARGRGGLDTRGGYMDDESDGSE